MRFPSFRGPRPDPSDASAKRVSGKPRAMRSLGELASWTSAVLCSSGVNEPEGIYQHNGIWCGRYRERIRSIHIHSTSWCSPGQGFDAMNCNLPSCWEIQDDWAGESVVFFFWGWGFRQIQANSLQVGAVLARQKRQCEVLQFFVTCLRFLWVWVYPVVIQHSYGKWAIDCRLIYTCFESPLLDYLQCGAP